jgi:hypothetical protein
VSMDLPTMLLGAVIRVEQDTPVFLRFLLRSLDYSGAGAALSRGS